MKNKSVLAIVVPCYNESAVFEYCHSKLNSVLDNLIDLNLIDEKSHILFVDDGSADDTWEKIRDSAIRNKKVKGIKLSRNKGHQIALMAGLKHSCSDVTISIDADLQDDTDKIIEMVKHYNDGIDIVYGVRNDRTTDTLFKKNTANIFYKFMSYMGVEQIENHADFRLLSSKAKEALLSYNEESIYIRGLIPLIGFKTEKVFYRRKERIAGDSKYPLGKMISLAVNGITSLSVKPLRMITSSGFIISFFSIIVGIYSVIQKLLGNTIEGWTSVIIAIFLLGGLQMLSLGIIGEYIGKIYTQSKNRPKFFISDEVSNNG